MVLQSTGAISFDDIQTEFGGTNPIGMDEYYAGGAIVPSGTGSIPLTGAINLGHFYGTSKQQPFYYPDYTNFYTDMSRYTSSYTITQSGSDPNVQLQMNSASVASSVTHLYAQNRIQDNNTVTIEFDIYISSSAVADALYFYMGYNSVPSSSYIEATSSTAYQLVMEIYQYSALPRGFHLIKNGTTTAAASYNTSSHIASTWFPIKIVWNKSSTNTFQIYFNGSNIINYSDASVVSFLNGSGAY